MNGAWFRTRRRGAADREANHRPTVNPHNERVIKAIRGQVAATLDHITGLGILLATTGPIRPAFVTARAVLVAAKWRRAIWRGRGKVEADAWRLYFVVVVDGEPVGMQTSSG